MNVEWIILAIFVAALVVAGVMYIIHFIKLSPEQKKQKLLELLYSLVVMAEQDIQGQGKGAEKLHYVEELFQQKAPLIYHYLLKTCGSVDLDDLIEKALEVVKTNFS